MSPSTATVSIASPTNLVFTVSAGTGTNLTSILNAGSTVNSSNYTYSDGTLTIKSAYLAGLTAGAKVFTVNMDDGSSATTTITVTA